MQNQLWRGQGARPKTAAHFTKRERVEEAHDEQRVELWRDIPLPTFADSNEVITLEETCQKLESCSLPTPATSRSVCKHGYNHRCTLLFPCCGVLYRCHRCHNEAETGCHPVRSSEATHLMCSQCNQKQKVCVFNLSNFGFHFCTNVFSTLRNLRNKDERTDNNICVQYFSTSILLIDGLDFVHWPTGMAPLIRQGSRQTLTAKGHSN